MVLHAGDSTVVIHLSDRWFSNSLETLSTNVPSGHTRTNVVTLNAHTGWFT